MPTLEQARAWYNYNDPVHGFDHIVRVLRMAERLAQEEGADLEIVRAAALLHDARGSAPGEESQRAQHHLLSAAFAAEELAAEGWPQERIEAVQHAIRAHRFRSGGEAPQTIEAQILYDSDKLDVLGAIGAARTIGYAVQDGQPVYAEPSEQFIQTGRKQPGEPHSSYHEYLFKLRKIKDRLFTRSARALAEARHDYLAGFYAQLEAEVRGER